MFAFLKGFVWLLFSSAVLGQTYSNSFTPIWQDLPWGAGGLTPSGPAWSLSGMLDVNGNGLGEFLVSSSWSGAFGNDAILYEADGNDAFQIVWYYSFSDLDLGEDNFSAATVGDLDGDQLPELVILSDCAAGQDALCVFEYDPVTGGFPAQPTASWNVNMPGGVLESGDLEIANVDSDPRPELLMTLYARDPSASHLVIAELAEGSDLTNPEWHVELDDNTTLAYYAYEVLATDLDRDGFSEVIVVEWNYNRMVFWENSAEDQYGKVNDLFVTLLPLSFCNDGAVEANLDNDGFNELYLASTSGFFWVITNEGDVSRITYSDHFHVLGDYYSEGGYNITQAVLGNADTPVGQPPDGSDIYLCATDSNATKSVVFDWEFLGGEVNDPSSYRTQPIFTDDDGDGALFKPAALVSGNFFPDIQQELIIASFSLDADAPHLIALKSSDPVGLLSSADPSVSNGFFLEQNYPNPFNPETHIGFSLPTAGEVTLTVFDALGREVIILLQGVKPAGLYSIRWDGRDAGGRPIVSGVYLYTLRANGMSSTRKLLYLN